jgi:hypothetical protein
MKTNFVHYNSLKRAVLERLKIVCIKDVNELKIIGQLIESSISVYNKHKNGCKKIYIYAAGFQNNTAISYWRRTVFVLFDLKLLLDL